MILRLLAIFLLMFAANTNAQEIPSEVQDILKQTVAVDGHLTEGMHRRFWSELRKLGSQDEKEYVMNTLNANVLMMQEYQKELWDSAKITYESKRVVKTERLIQLEKEFPIITEKLLAYIKGTPNYQRALITAKKQMKVSMDNSMRLLNSAATRSSMTSVQGQVIPIDMNIINTVRANISSSFSRVRNLLNENWKEEP